MAVNLFVAVFLKLQFISCNKVSIVVNGIVGLNYMRSFSLYKDNYCLQSELYTISNKFKNKVIKRISSPHPDKHAHLDHNARTIYVLPYLQNWWKFLFWNTTNTAV